MSGELCFYGGGVGEGIQSFLGDGEERKKYDQEP